jgi:AcrR family transcriptional regulator
MTSTSTVEQILEGAAHALARRGATKLFMSDICDEAGVSRGTLYRYFKSKEDVLEALSQHVVLSMRSILEEAVAKNPDPDERIRVVLEAMVSFGDRLPYTRAIVEAEPGFALDFFQRTMGTHVGILVDVLGPAVTEAPPVQAGVMTPRQLAEILQRVALSAYLIPSSDSQRLARTFAATWTALLDAHREQPAGAVAAAAGSTRGKRARVATSA